MKNNSSRICQICQKEMQALESCDSTDPNLSFPISWECLACERDTEIKLLKQCEENYLLNIK